MSLGTTPSLKVSGEKQKWASVEANGPENSTRGTTTTVTGHVTKCSAIFPNKPPVTNVMVVYN
tara:strand:+ start:1239 stop:1427 length:189 start_codon:yes stop_codon:yes gene_type:complete